MFIDDLKHDVPNGRKKVLQYLEAKLVEIALDKI